jgi:hypothetical protein
MEKPFEISFFSNALEEKSNALVPCLTIISPIMPAQAQMVIAGRYQDLIIAKRSNGSYAISSLIWSDSAIHLQIGEIKVVIVKALDHVNCALTSQFNFVVAKQSNGGIAASTPIKQDFAQLHLGEVIGVQQV